MGISYSKLIKKTLQNNEDYYTFTGIIGGETLNFNVFINKYGNITKYKISYKNVAGGYTKKSRLARIIEEDKLDSYCLGCFEINGNYYDIILEYDSVSSSFTKAKVRMRNEMIENASKIADCLSDYKNNPISTESVMSWAVQFDDDAQFILDETAHFIDKIYFSKSKVESILKKWILELRNDFDSWESFLKDVLFINTQEGKNGVEKSQNALYNIISDIIKKETGKAIEDYISWHKKVYVYADDILASGNTLGDDVKEYIKRYNCKDKRFCCWVICCHSIQLERTLNSISIELTESFDSPIKDNLINNFRCEYMIDNGNRKLGQNDYQNRLFNCIEPLDSDLSREIMSSKERYGDDKNVHLLSESEINEERFFTSFENRKRYTELILKTSNMLLEEFLLNRADKPTYRPLGFTKSSSPSLGLGTLFITWRNIPNNCPFAFWGDVNGWKPLCSRNKTK